MSHGSHCPYRNSPMSEPVNEQPGLPTYHFPEPGSSPGLPSRKLAVLMLGPAHQFLIDMIVKPVQG